MATKVVNDLVTKFSFAGPLAPLAKYNNLLGTSIGKLALWTAAIAGATAIFEKWAHGVLMGVDSLDALSYQSRIAVSELQTLNYMAEQNQSSAAAMQSTISNLGNTIGAAAQRGSEDFARLGISVRDSYGHIKTADRILGEVQNRFRTLNLSLEEQRTFAGALGIDASLLRLLNQSASEMAELRAQAEAFGTLTDKQADQAAAYTRSVKALSFGLDSLRNLIAVGVGPQMERMVAGFGELLRNNRDWIVNGIQIAFKWLGHMWDALKRIAPTIGVLTAGVVLLKIALLDVGVALRAIGKIGIVLAITAIILAIDDLIVAFRGGKSVIADFFQQNFGTDVVEELTLQFGALQAAAGEVWTALKQFFGWLNHLGADLGAALANLGLGGLLDQLSKIGEVAAGLFDTFNAIGRALGRGLFEVIEDVRGLVAPEVALTAPEIVAPEVALTAPEIVAPEVALTAPEIVAPEVALTAPEIVAPEVALTAPEIVAPNTPRDTLRPYPQMPAGANNTTINRYIDQRNEIKVSTSDPARATQLMYDSLDRQLDNANAQLSVGGR